MIFTQQQYADAKGFLNPTAFHNLMQTNDSMKLHMLKQMLDTQLAYDLVSVSDKPLELIATEQNAFVIFSMSADATAKFFSYATTRLAGQDEKIEALQKKLAR